MNGLPNNIITKCCFRKRPRNIVKMRMFTMFCWFFGAYTGCPNPSIRHLLQSRTTNLIGCPRFRICLGHWGSLFYFEADANTRIWASRIVPAKTQQNIVNIGIYTMFLGRFVKQYLVIMLCCTGGSSTTALVCMTKQVGWTVILIG